MYMHLCTYMYVYLASLIDVSASCVWDEEGREQATVGRELQWWIECWVGLVVLTCCSTKIIDTRY